MRNIILVLILIIMLTGCTGIFDLTNFTMPDDMEFMEVVESLDTPEKIGSYMLENFEFKANLYYTPDPYTLWKIKEGDCSDFATFGMFVADYHGYETYIAKIYLKSLNKHAIAIYKEDGKYNFSSNRIYYKETKNTIRECVFRYFYYQPHKGLKSYDVYDYNMTHIMGGK